MPYGQRYYKNLQKWEDRNAFATPSTDDHIGDDGLSVREYAKIEFIAAALPGLIQKYSLEKVPELAIDMADAILAELDNRPTA